MSAKGWGRETKIPSLYMHPIQNACPFPGCSLRWGVLPVVTPSKARSMVPAYPPLAEVLRTYNGRIAVFSRI